MSHSAPRFAMPWLRLPLWVRARGADGSTLPLLERLSRHRLESDSQPGGMLFSAIPSYRLPHEVIRKEISSLLDENITLKCKHQARRDITLDSLLDEGYKAVFVAIGAQ